MLTYPNIDPIAFSIGSLSIRWYGISYLVGFAAAFLWCVSKRNAQPKPWTIEQIGDLFFYVAVGVIFGGTFGYVLFYHPSLLWENPWVLFKFWEPGRSFHGGLLGVIIALLVYARVHKRHFWDISDFICPAIPLGLAAGRIGNFLNGELWGRVTNVPWGMVFPFAGPELRHPSQLYEFLLEGLLLFAVLAWVSRKPRARGVISGFFLLGYGVCRSFVEFFREPDIAQGFILGDWFTMGQLLSIPMIVIGLLLLILAKENKPAKKKVT